MARLRPASRDANTLALSLRCNLAEVQPAIQTCHAFLSRHALPENLVDECELALAEACNNAIQNTAPAAATQPVRIELQFAATEVEIRVTDQSPGFVLPKNAQLPDPESERGRGLYLIYCLMDSVDYRKTAAGNELVMRKRI